MHILVQLLFSSNILAQFRFPFLAIEQMLVALSRIIYEASIVI